MTRSDDPPDLIVHRGLFTTLDRSNPAASAVAIKDGIFTAVGHDRDVLPLAGKNTRVIDLLGRRVLPGLIDNHLHIIRGGLNFNMELRWDGVRSLADAMAMLKHQVAVTPAPQWVRVVGGFTAHQFAEKRLPTIDEINAVAPETPVFLLHLYDRAILNGAAVRACSYTKDTPEPVGGQIARDSAGEPTGLLLAKPNAAILYATLARGPKLPFEYQLNSTRHFMRELNRLGVTGAIDAGGGFQNYPEDYAVVQKLNDEGQLTIRLAYNLFTQKPKGEKEDFLNWTKTSKYKQGDDYFRHNGAGEMLVFSAADFEDFRQRRPDMPPEMEVELESVVRILVENRWPWRLHSTYDETISRALDVFERVNQDIPLAGLNWFFDHAETISDESIDRIAALGGGIAIQHRMAYQGEYFVERYGIGAAEATPPVKRILESGVKVSAGTDATRVASYNPWVSLAWLVTGKTVGGMHLYPQRNCLDRETALRMWTENVTWFSNEEGKKGRIKVGQLADLIVPDRDYFSCAEDDIADTTSLLTIVGGRVVFASGDFARFDDNAPPPALPDWSPVRTYG
ncbi:MAG TPA: amidohydrolase, partial [Xanthomonadaceae bacterium]|nr:amidohydrolase [Xanthomonadaceae bacterium]